MKTLRFFSLFVLLLPCVVTDIKSRRLPAPLMALMGAAALLYRVLFRADAMTEVLSVLMITAPILALACFSRSIGLGDVLMIAAAGLITGGAALLSALLMGLILAAAAGLPGLLTKGKKGRKELPFAPFFAAGVLLEMLFRP